MKLSYILVLAAATLAFVQAEEPARNLRAVNQRKPTWAEWKRKYNIGNNAAATQEHAVKLEAQHHEKAAAATEHAHQNKLGAPSPALLREINERKRRGGAQMETEHQDDGRLKEQVRRAVADVIERIGKSQGGDQLETEPQERGRLIDQVRRAVADAIIERARKSRGGDQLETELQDRGRLTDQVRRAVADAIIERARKSRGGAQMESEHHANLQHGHHA